MSRHVAVLMGGMSAEREVSLTGGRAAAEALERRGYRVSTIDADRELCRKLAAVKPDVVYNALHGPYGEDGTVQGLLEILGLPYSHSGVLASALAMDKAMAKTMFAAAGIRCPESVMTTIDQLDDGEHMEPPYVIKPNREGSSVGVTIIRDEGDRLPLRNSWPYGPDIMIERFVEGRELTVSVLGTAGQGDRPLGVTEVRPKNDFFDYHAKYTEGQTEHLLPAPVSTATYQRAMDDALTAHRALGCRGVTRADFMLAEDDPDALYLLEINTTPGMTPISLVPEQALHVGIDFGDLVELLVEEARCDAA
ncbi:MAG: D-alanine--D-alanine ligase [Alphaproteobacteria bacterium]|nr:D-alanine--D-alanine ligase [Alphaproteobacteria bacterium]